MDHLLDRSFMAMSETEKIEVEYVLSEHESDIASLFRRTTFDYTDFVSFPEERGWTADEKNNFRLRRTTARTRNTKDKDKDKDKETEREDTGASKRNGAGTGTTDMKNGAKAVPPQPEYKEVEILQAWLFFALIACVVRKDKEPAQSRIRRRRDDGPTASETSLDGSTQSRGQNGDTVAILDLGELVIGDRPKFLTTRSLLAALQHCHDCIKSLTPKAKLHARLIEIDRTLELARRVVRANMVPKPPSPHGNGLLNGSSLTMRGTEHNSTNTIPPTNGSVHGDIFQDEIYPLGRSSSFPKPVQESEAQNRQLQELSLCLMVLGETLSAAKLQMMNDLGLRMNGWLTDDDDGWGPPSLILTRMEKSWCPRASAVIQGQLGFSAILLYTAFPARQKAPTDKKEHQKCHARQCHHVPGVIGSGNKKVFYPPQHHPSESECMKEKRKDCQLLGPNMPKLYEILKDATMATEGSNFPILRIVSKINRTRDESNNETEVMRVLGVTVERWGLETRRTLRKPHFTAISHVWSQGMGNERSNKLQECQLELILTALLAAEAETDKMNHAPLDKAYAGELLKQVLEEGYHEDEVRNYHISPPFWMDTLAIPVSQDKSQLNFKDLKTRAIRQIYHVFNNAARVVVIDKDLCKEWALHPFHTILKVLTSAWMQRLWTLQEAFLSRNLLVAFRSDARGRRFDGLSFEQSGVVAQVDLQNLDSIIRQLDRPQNAHTTAMAELIKRKFFHNLMGEDREIRNRNDHPVETRGSMVIASAWRSSRWRNTSRLEDETLALSTLLNLDYRDTRIEATVKESAMKQSTSAGNVPDTTTTASNEGMMQDFWTLIHKNYEGSIPAGLIFLPGEKLSGPGFGWAPKTWMSAHDEDYPYPLSIPSRPTELHEDGLLVQYPGFLLQCGHPNTILGSNLAMSSLSFPIDQSMSEWYQVKALDGARTEFGATQMMLSKSHEPSHLEFGVILSRPRPREWPEEIGLLVQIYRETWKRKEPERISRRYFYCQIVRHVLVSRTAPPPKLKKFKLPAGQMGDHPIGEAMPEDTLWYVDGYQPNRDKPRQQPKSESSTPDAQGLAHAKPRPDRRSDAFQAMRRLPGVKRSSSSVVGGFKTSSPQLDRASTSYHTAGRSVPSIQETEATAAGAVTPDSQDEPGQQRGIPRTPESTASTGRWGMLRSIFYTTPKEAQDKESSL